MRYMDTTNRVKDAVILFLVFIVVILACSLVFVVKTGNSDKNTSITPTQAPFSISSIDLTADPSSVAGLSCGHNLTVQYTATFHAPVDTKGGPVNFSYTTDNGRGSTSAQIQFVAGQLEETYIFSATGLMSADHTFPGIAEVLVSSPNPIHSSQVQVNGKCQ